MGDVREFSFPSTGTRRSEMNFQPKERTLPSSLCAFFSPMREFEGFGKRPGSHLNYQRVRVAEPQGSWVESLPGNPPDRAARGHR